MEYCLHISGIQVSEYYISSFVNVKNNLLRQMHSRKRRYIKKMDDEEAIEYLCQLRQIGKWSAEMILMFTFNRPNIWPTYDKKKTLDIGLLRAISKNYKNIDFVRFLKHISLYEGTARDSSKNASEGYLYG